MSFLWLRLPRKRLLLAMSVAFAISALQMIQVLGPIPPMDSPYTRWLSIDPFNFSPIIFFILLPLIASIPAASLLKEDADSGLLQKLNCVFLSKSYPILCWISLFDRFYTCGTCLALNLLFYFMMLPNIRPDNLLNSNILLTNQNTLFVSLYYANPLLHALISILFASFWVGFCSSLSW